MSAFVAGLLTLIAVTAAPIFAAHTLYLDATNGNDTTGDGSSGKPYKTFSKTLTAVVAGDTVLMNNGDYGAVSAGRTPDGGTAIELFADWVTFKAAPGQTPHATSITLGNLWYINSSGARVQLDIGRSHPKGNVNCYLRFEGLTVDDGVSIEGSRYVYIKNCIINRAGVLNGSVGIIDNKAGIDSSYGAYITLEGNEITHCAVGISVAGSYTVIKDNHIHHNSHDGIHMLGGSDWLIEGNRIHNLDDGVDDSSGLDWNRHCDGIQAYDLNGDGSDAICNVQIRRNLFYHIECMGIMLQCKTDSLTDSELVAPGRFSNWIIENNVFGPTGSQAIIVGVDISGGFVLRHNSTLHAPNDTWTSIYGRTMQGTNNNIQMWADTTRPERANILKSYRVYNNIFGDAEFANYGPTYSTYASTYGFVGGNLYYGSGNTLSNGDRWYSIFPYEAISGSIQDWLDAGHMPGKLLDGSAAINTGSATYASELLDDYSGRARDSQPDIGACEYITTPAIIAPQITTQPQSLTMVAAGGSFTLTVVATGTSPAYLWRKDGIAISGAPSQPNYSVINMTAALAGTYSVVVSNSAGSATSTNAVVQLSGNSSSSSSSSSSPSSSSSSSSSSSTSSGGGGGAPGLWFLTALSLLSVGRIRFRLRHGSF